MAVGRDGAWFPVEEGLIENFAVVSQDQETRTTNDGITIYPWREFLDELWGGKLR